MYDVFISFINQKMNEDLKFLCILNICLIAFINLLVNIFSESFPVFVVIISTICLSLLYNFGVLCEIYPQIPALLEHIQNDMRELIKRRQERRRAMFNEQCIIL